jgi:hypothetical protein
VIFRDEGRFDACRMSIPRDRSRARTPSGGSGWEGPAKGGPSSDSENPAYIDTDVRCRLCTCGSATGFFGLHRLRFEQAQSHRAHEPLHFPHGPCLHTHSPAMTLQRRGKTAAGRRAGYPSSDVERMRSCVRECSRIPGPMSILGYDKISRSGPISQKRSCDWRSSQRTRIRTPSEVYGFLDEGFPDM